jgi:hypothetical protein
MSAGCAYGTDTLSGEVQVPTDECEQVIWMDVSGGREGWGPPEELLSLHKVLGARCRKGNFARMTRSSLLKPLAAVKPLSGLGSGSALAALTNPGSTAPSQTERLLSCTSDLVPEHRRGIARTIARARPGGGSRQTYSADLALLETFNGAGAGVATDSKTCRRGKHIPDFQVPSSASLIAPYQRWL